MGGTSKTKRTKENGFPKPGRSRGKEGKAIKAPKENELVREFYAEPFTDDPNLIEKILEGRISAERY